MKIRKQKTEKSKTVGAGIAILFALFAIFVSFVFASCGGNKKWNENSEINVISREEGSGTRGAFIELFGIEKKSADGKKIDFTTDEASVTNSTAVMMTTVSQNQYAIGYISLGSLNDSVKAVKIDGAAATVENIKNGTYKIVRPFNVAVKENLSDSAKDFLNYVLSEKGQQIIEENKYIKISADNSISSSENQIPDSESESDSSVNQISNSTKELASSVNQNSDSAKKLASSINQNSGTTKKLASSANSIPSKTILREKVVVSGSSSVSPVIEKLIESYKAENPDAKIELQTSDSTTGIANAISGTCDIGLASRSLKATELSKGVKEITIAMDGIAVIVNNSNPFSDISKNQVEKIFTGETTKWNEIRNQ